MFHTIPTSVCTRTQENKAISRQPVCLTDYDYDYILEEIGHQENIKFEIYAEAYSNELKGYYEHFK